VSGVECSRHHRGPQQLRRRRGAALLVTVLLCSTAATIALVVLRQATATGRFETYQRSSVSAETEARAAVAAFESRLALDATFYLREVWQEEPARVCAQVGEATVVAQPGAAWPAHCGTSWTYVEPDTPSSVYTFLTPPNRLDDRLQVDVVVRNAGGRAGLGVRYRATDAGRWAVWSAGPLDMSRLAQGGVSTTLAGGVYATGPITLSSAVAVDGTQMVADTMDPTPFVGVRSAAAWWYAGTEDLVVDPPLRPARSTVPLAGSTVWLKAEIDALHRLACIAGPASGAGTLCLMPGVPTLTAADEIVTPPSGPTRASWLLVLNASGPDTVEVYFADKDLDICPPDRDLAAWSSPLLAAGLHPGDIDFWENTGDAVPSGYGCVSATGPGGVTKLGVFTLPSSGLIAVDGDVVVGHCGVGFATEAGACTTWDGDGFSQAMTVTSSLTIAATGDIYLGGPIRVQGTARLGVATPGAVVVPYWARAFGSSLNLETHIVALDVAGSVRFSPAAAPTDPQAGDTAPAVSLTGRLTVASLGEGFTNGGWSTVQVTPADGVPAWLPTPTPGVERAGTIRLLDPEIDALLAGLTPPE
jgi:hypothetical protein